MVGLLELRENDMKLLSVEQTAGLLQVSRQTIDRMISEGVLPAILLRSGRRKKVWRIREEVLERWLLQHEKQTTKAHGGRNGKVENESHENAA